MSRPCRSHELRRFPLALLLAAQLVLGAEPASAAPAAKVIAIEGVTEYALDNGLKVLLYPDDSSTTTTVNITYKVGSRFESYGETGMAHLLEHLSFKGTPRNPNIPAQISSHGASANATTSDDRTNYFETFPATRSISNGLWGWRPTGWCTPSSRRRIWTAR